MSDWHLVTESKGPPGDLTVEVRDVLVASEAVSQAAREARDSDLTAGAIDHARFVPASAVDVLSAALRRLSDRLTPRERHLVISGNWNEAEEFARRHGWHPADWAHLSGLDQALGLRPEEWQLHLVGTWQHSPSACRALSALQRDPRWAGLALASMRAAP